MTPSSRRFSSIPSRPTRKDLVKSLSYHWAFPDGGTSSAKNPAHLFATTVIFGNVTLIVSDLYGDQTRIVKTITVVK